MKPKNVLILLFLFYISSLFLPEIKRPINFNQDRITEYQMLYGYMNPLNILALIFLIFLLKIDLINSFFNLSHQTNKFNRKRFLFSVFLFTGMLFTLNYFTLESLHNTPFHDETTIGFYSSKLFYVLVCLGIYQFHNSKLEKDIMV